MQNISKNWLILLAIVIVAGLGLYAYKNPPQRINENDDSSIDISGWKTYREDRFGFEFKYPADLITKDDTANAQAALYTLFDAKIEGQDATRFASAVIEGDIESNREKFSGPLSSDFQEIKVAGKDGFKVVYGDAGCAGESTVLPLKGNTLVMSVGYCEGDLMDPEENYKIFNKVLETLRID